MKDTFYSFADIVFGFVNDIWEKIIEIKEILLDE